MVAVTGNTFPVRDQLKALGGRWDADARVWQVPESQAEAARALVANAPAAPRRGGIRDSHAPSPLPEGWIEVTIGSGYLLDDAGEGSVILAKSGRGGGLAHRLPGAAPGSCWVVAAVRKQWVREDGMSFGVGDESGFLYTFRLRPATEEEAAPVREAEAAAARRAEARRELAALFDQVDRDGTYEPGSHVLSGEEIEIPASGQRIYGGGRWFVIEEADGRIWAVRNNGRDGDDWGANNVRTGGAGAIGRFVPYDGELAARIRATAGRAK